MKRIIFRYLFFCIITISVTYQSAIVNAHTDSIIIDSELSLVMHIEPNHYPVAGRENNIVFFYDQNKWELSKESDSAVLESTYPSGEMATTEAYISGEGSITARQNFPAHGLYTLGLVVETGNNGLKRFDFEIETIEETTKQKSQSTKNVLKRYVGGFITLVSFGLLSYAYIRGRTRGSS